MAAGHFGLPKITFNGISRHFRPIGYLYWSEMARNAIESDFRSSKMAAGSHFVKQNYKNKSCVLIWNGEKSDRKWFSVIQNGRRQPFCEKIKLRIDLKYEKCDRKWFSVIQNGHRQPFCEKNQIHIKVAYWSEMARNAIESDFRSSKMATGGHFVDKKSKLRIDLKWREMRSKVIFGHPKWPLAAILRTKKLRIDLKWREMRSEVIFGHPKWAPVY